jgi:tetratricopeptide (TPR) repeat protein
MNSERTMIPRKPLNVVNDNDRPQKRQKAGVSTHVLLGLIETGVAHYDHGDHNAAEEYFSQSLCYVDIEYSCSLNVTKAAKAIDTIKKTNNSARCNGKFECQQRVTEANTNIEYDEGMGIYRGLLQIQEAHPDDEIAAMLFYNLAQTYVQRGFHREAIRWFHKSLDKFLTLRGVNRLLHIVVNLHSLGYCLYRTGNEDEAKDFYHRALTLSSEHNQGGIHLAASVNCVGVIIFNQQESCNTAMAMEMFRNSLTLYRSDDNADVTSIATVLNNIGRVHYMRSDFGKALKIYQECLQLRRESLGYNSADVAATVYNLGQTCYQLGKLDESLSYYHEFLKIAISVAGPSSKDVALVYKGIAEIYQDKSDCKMGLHYFQKALNVLGARSKGRPSADFAAISNRMGNLCYEMKDYSSAMKHYQAGLIVEKEMLAPNHPHLIITTTNIGHIHKQLGDFRKALSAYKTVHRMQRKKLGDDSFVLAETMSSIGVMQYYLKNYEASFDSYQEALRIRRQHLGGDEHPEIASTLNSIGLVLFKQDFFELAKDCFTESLRIRSKLLGKNHRDVAILWYNIATIHFETGEDELSIQMYKETLRVERHALGDDHPDVVLTLQHLGQVHQQLGHTEKAIDYFQEALDMERRRKEPVKRALARILNLLGNVYLQLGRTSEMMGRYAEASRIYESNRVSGETLVIGGYNFYGLSKTNPPCAPVA